MESSTQVLRRLLDERGVEWETDRSGFRVMWGKPVDEFHDTMQFNAVDNALQNGGLNVHICGFTPEQAIAATLGDADATGARQGDAGTCHDMGGCRWFRCSACGFGIEDMYVNDEDEYPPEDQPRYCPNCGRLVVEVDK